MKPAFFLNRDQEIISQVFEFSQQNKVNLYLVGGYLRDIILGRKKENPDIDFSLESGSIKFGRKLAASMKAGFVVLDKERRVCRVVKKTKERIYTLDFMDFRGATLEQDLRLRDFTINCLSLELKNIFEDKDFLKNLIDPLGGFKDLKLKVIRLASLRAFDEDPLRILRAFSLASIFSFKIDSAVLKQAKAKKAKLSKVSPERIRDELFKLFAQPDAFAYFLQMDKLGLLKQIIPQIKQMDGIKQGPYHHLDIWSHTLETFRQLENLFQELKRNKDIMAYLNEVVSGERRRYALLKLAAILHDIGKPSTLRYEGKKVTFHGHERVGLGMASKIGKWLKLSNGENYSLGRVILWHLRPGYLADNFLITARAKFRYFRDAGADATAILLLSIADQRATKGKFNSKKSRVHHEKVALNLIKEYFHKNKEEKVPRLINGDDLIKEFKLQSSPLIGEILSQIEELQAIGKVRNKEEALRIARRCIQSK